MSDETPGGDERSHEEWLQRRADLAEKLQTQRAKLSPQKAGGGSAGGMRGAADGMKLASEFIAGVLAGAGIGYLLDRIAGTGPFGLIVFLILGFVAGVLNVLRSVGKTSTPAIPQTSTTPDRKAAIKGENSPQE